MDNSDQTVPKPSFKEIEDGYAALHAATLGMLEGLPTAMKELIQSLLEFRYSLRNESDRGAALMTAAYIDDRLKGLIEARLVADKKVVRHVFEFQGALGSFSARTDFAYLLGLIPKNVAQEVHRIRKIRNRFAHEAGLLTFESEAIKKDCDQLTFHGRAGKPGQNYRRAAVVIATEIIMATVHTGHIVAAPAALIPDRQEIIDMTKGLWVKVTGIPYPEDY